MNDTMAIHAAPIVATNAATVKRDRALRTTLEHIVLTDGFSRLSVSEMARRLGCSKRTIYELAPTKSALVLQILSTFFANIRVAAGLANDNYTEPSRQVFDYLQVGVEAAERLSPIVIADIDKWEPARLIWEEHIRLRVTGLRRLIEQGVAAGEFRDIHPVVFAESVFAGLSRLRDPDFSTRTELSLSRAFEEYYKMLLYALVPERAKSP